MKFRARPMQVPKPLPDTAGVGQVMLSPCAASAPGPWGCGGRLQPRLVGTNVTPGSFPFSLQWPQESVGLFRSWSWLPPSRQARLHGEAGVLQPPLHVWCPSHGAEPGGGGTNVPRHPRNPTPRLPQGCPPCPAPAPREGDMVQAATGSTNGSASSWLRCSAGSAASSPC